MITDGLNEVSRQSALDAAQTAKDSSVMMFAIGVGPNMDRGFIRSLASPPQNENYQWWALRSFTEFAGVQNPSSPLSWAPLAFCTSKPSCFQTKFIL